MDQTPPYLRSPSVSDISIRLNQRLSSIGKEPLKTIHVVPSELTGDIGWHANDYGGQEQQELNELLGKLAMNFVARELSNTLMVNQYTYDEGSRTFGKETRPFRIGLATGSTIFQLVESLDIEAPPCPIQIAPLVVGPVPETMYSAGFIANLFVKRFRSPDVKLLKIAETEYSLKTPGSIRLTLTKELRDLRDDPEPDRQGRRMAEFFDWVVTGIGAHDKGQLKAHVDKIYSRQTPHGLVGDVCSRLFGDDGRELAETKAVSDTFVAVSFAAMETMCRINGAGKRVIAIAGGKEKYPAIRTLLMRASPLFNVLVTDELTARRLLVDINRRG
ncbi:MAG: hypothetical protein NTW96_04565 [Planctomycetia bacterium]|nr:hypothetical protein [Planctomycetia bacterium]